MSRWRVPHRRYNRGWRGTPEGQRAKWKWTGLSILPMTGILVTAKIPLVPVALVVAFFAYAVRHNRHWRAVDAQARGQVSEPPPAQLLPPPGYRFNPAPDGRQRLPGGFPRPGGNPTGAGHRSPCPPSPAPWTR